MNLKDSLIENDSIVIGKKASSWEEAVKLGTDPLEKSGAIDKRYYESIIEQTKKIGPYYILLPGIAMPHSRPEAGVNKDCFGITVLEEPVKFGSEDNEYAQILFTLGATSSDAHTEEAIPQIVDLLEEEETIEKILKASSKEDILNLLS